MFLALHLRQAVTHKTHEFPHKTSAKSPKASASPPPGWVTMGTQRWEETNNMRHFLPKHHKNSCFPMLRQLKAMKKALAQRALYLSGEIFWTRKRRQRKQEGYIHINIYIYRERERERKRARQRCMYIYIYK